MFICPYCTSKTKFFFRISSRTYNQCLSCGLIYKTDQDKKKIIEHYVNEYFSQYSHSQVEQSRTQLFDNILNIIEKQIKTGHILDIGTGCGYFVFSAQKRGWNATGIDPSKDSVKAAWKINRVKIYQGTLKNYKTDKLFDVVTFINVLDHTVYPWQEVEEACNLLKPGGLIFMRFPNGWLHSKIYKIGKYFGIEHIIQKYLVFHQYSFTPEFIMKLLKNKGFTNIYVTNSPLSESDPGRLFSDPGFGKYLKLILYFISKILEIISNKKILIGSSLEVMAIKPD